MAEDGTLRQPAEQATGIGLTAGEGTRPAWAKPTMHRFSLQRTLAGSNIDTDTHKGTATAT
jgi:hypothetical protein